MDEHLLWKLGEGYRRRHRPPSDKEDEGGDTGGDVDGSGKRARALAKG